MELLIIFTDFYDRNAKANVLHVCAIKAFYFADFYNRNGKTTVARVNIKDFKTCNIAEPYYMCYGRYKYQLKRRRNFYFISIKSEQSMKGQNLTVCVKNHL